MDSANAGFEKIPESRLTSDINRILKKKNYTLLKTPFSHPEKCNSQIELSQRVITYCVLLKKLLDEDFWEKFRISEGFLHCSRVRYVIAGNVLKAIFTIHEKSKKQFLDQFEKAFVKVFTFPTLGQRLQVVVLKRITYQQVPNLRRTFPGLRITRLTKKPARANGLTAEDEIFNALLNSSGRVAHQLQNTVEDVPAGIEGVPQIQPAVQLGQENVPVAGVEIPEIQPAHQIQEYREEPPAIRVAAETSARSSTPEEILRRRQQVRECGIGDEAFKDIRDPEQFDRVLNEVLDKVPQFKISSARTVPRLSQGSDDTPSTFQARPVVDPKSLECRSPERISQIVEAGRTRRLSQSPNIASRTIQVRADVHSTLEQVEAEGILVQGARSNTNQVQTVGVRSMIDEAITIEENQPAVAGNYPLLSTSQPGQIPSRRIPENMIVEQAGPSTRENVHPSMLEVTDTQPARPTVADLLIQGALTEQVHPEVRRAIETRGRVVDLPADIANNLKQSAPIRPGNDEATERVTIPAKTPPRPRKQYIFHSNLVVRRKLKRDLEPPNFVSFAERLSYEVDLLRHPFYHILPFDKYEHNEENLHFIRRFDVRYDEDRIPSCSNILDNLFCGLFEHDDAEYDEENECEERVAHLRASVDVLIQQVLDESYPRIIGNAQPFDGAELPVVQVQAPNADIPEIPAQISANVPQMDALQIPTVESRISMRISQGAVQHQSRASLQVEGPPQINAQPVDNRMSIVPLPRPREDFPQIPARISMNLPQIDDAPLQIPAPVQPSILSTPSMPQPTVQAVAVDVNVSETTEQRRDTEVEEVIPQKRLRGTVQESIADIAQLAGTPVVLERQQSSILSTRIVPSVHLEEQPIQQSLLVFEPTPLMEAILGLERQQEEHPSAQPRSPVGIVPPAVIVPIEEPVRERVSSRPMRDRFSMEDVMELLGLLWSERWQNPIPFTMLCPEDCTDRLTAASILSILIDMHNLKIITLTQDPKDGTPNSVWISLSRDKPEPVSYEPIPGDSESESGSSKSKPDDSEPEPVNSTSKSGDSDFESGSSNSQSGSPDSESNNSTSESEPFDPIVEPDDDEVHTFIAIYRL